jgi:glucoamylase
VRLIPEQTWDAGIPEKRMFFGQGKGAAIPLVWAHAEYVKILRSVADNRMFDLIDPVAGRYCNDQPRRVIEVWR